MRHGEWLEHHLGVAYYLKGDFARAAAAYQSCLDNSTGADTIECIAWLYPSLIRAGRKSDAAALLERVQADPAITGHPAWYLDRLLLFKGVRTEEQVAASKFTPAWGYRCSEAELRRMR